MKTDAPQSPFVLARQAIHNKRQSTLVGDTTITEQDRFVLNHVTEAEAKATTALMHIVFMAQMIDMLGQGNPMPRFKKAASELEAGVLQFSYNAQEQQASFTLHNYGKLADIEFKLRKMQETIEKANKALVKDVPDMPDGKYLVLLIPDLYADKSDTKASRSIRVTFTQALSKALDAIASLHGDYMPPIVTNSYLYDDQEISLLTLHPQTHEAILSGADRGIGGRK